MNMTKAILWALLSVTTNGFAAQVCKETIFNTTPDSRFMINGTEVTDNATGLIWQRCSYGKTGADCNGGHAILYTWQQALQAAEQKRLATGKAWRLPNVKELESLVEEKCYQPAINLTVFPSTPSLYYWSGSPSANNMGSAWGVGFNNGYSDDQGKENNRAVRFVRGGQ